MTSNHENRNQRDVLNGEDNPKLLKTYGELGFWPVEVRGTLPERLHTVIKRLGLKTMRSADEAIRLAELFKKNSAYADFDSEKVVRNKLHFP
ncbi:MAG: hypothetical protein LBS79_01410 [Tannerella sp.]|jgi:glutamyl/glutaminyl-tRNA synthetase|nr:hypothetical protein [Tannerella sp.]